MKKVRNSLILLLISILLLTIACKITQEEPGNHTPVPTTGSTTVHTQIQATKTPISTPEPSASASETTIPTTVPTTERKHVDYSLIQPNESGEIPVLMFHNFIEDLSLTHDVEWTTSFEVFENLLETLYHDDYRLISMRDFIDHNIAVPEGKIPLVLTFDDGTPGQFSLIEKDGEYIVNPASAVGVMLKFNEKYPDFGLKGIFYLNMDKEEKTFEGAGSLKERLEILLDYGFEIGNHSWGHFNFETATNREQIYEKLGKNEKRLKEILPDRTFYSLALPHGGKAPQEIAEALVKGEFEGTPYNNESIMAVGYLPSVPSIHAEYDSTYVRRIRSQGKEAIKFDLTYWLPLMTQDRMYISDGDPDTIVVPESRKNRIDSVKAGGKTIIPY